MNEQTTQMLQALADKLNTTAENLWAVLIAQAKIEGITSIVWSVACLVAMVIIYKIVRWMWHGLTEEDWEEFTFVPMGILILVGVVLIFPAVSYFNWAVTCFANPDYYALSHVLRAIK